jgi:DNA-binding FadR family transcriptional regulator
MAYGHSVSPKWTLNPKGLSYPMEAFKFAAVKSNLVSQKVAKQIRHLILHGKLRPGDEPLRERELSKTLGMGRQSSREGAGILKSMEMLRAAEGIHFRISV